MGMFWFGYVLTVSHINYQRSAVCLGVVVSKNETLVNYYHLCHCLIQLLFVFFFRKGRHPRILNLPACSNKEVMKVVRLYCFYNCNFTGLIVACYLVTLLPCCHLVTLLPCCYPVTLSLPCYPVVTSLPCYSVVTSLPRYPVVTSLHCYSVVTSLSCYPVVTSLPCYPVVTSVITLLPCCHLCWR